MKIKNASDVVKALLQYHHENNVLWLDDADLTVELDDIIDAAKLIEPNFKPEEA